MKLEIIKSVRQAEGAIYSICPGSETLTVYAAGADRKLTLWDMKSASAIESFLIPNTAYSIKNLGHPQGIVAGLSDGHFSAIVQGQAPVSVRAHLKGIYDFYQAGDRFYTAGGDGELGVYLWPALEKIGTKKVAIEKIRQLSISPDGMSLACASGDGMITMLDLSTLDELIRFKAHEGGVTSLAWHPTKPVLLSGGRDAMLKFWNYRDEYREVLSIPAHNYAIYSIVFNTELEICATCSRDKTIKIWSSSSFDLMDKADPSGGGHSHSVNSLLWIGNTLISCGDDRRIIAWEMAHRKEV